MVGMMVKKQWWFDNQNKSTPSRSPWLQSTLAELDHKTESMLKLIEADADSFAQRAEMYYKKRPELISMVEEFYRSHKSLAEKHDQVKSDSGSRVLTTLCSPFSAAKYHLEKSPSGSTFHTYDCCSEICDGEDSDDQSEIDDSEPKNSLESVDLVHENPKESELERLREEISRLEGENRAQREELKRKDEEKREAIRHLSLAVDMLKQENVKLRRFVVAAKETPTKKKGSFEFNKFKDGLFGKWFNSPVVAL